MICDDFGVGGEIAQGSPREEDRRTDRAESAERATPNAALCGAQPSLAEDATAGEVLAGPAVGRELDAPLTARQSRVAAMLASGMSVREIAAVTGLHRGTIFRWRQSSVAFRREQRRFASEAAGELSGIARRLLVKATGYIERLMEEESARDEWAARILRSRQLWNLAMTAREDADC